MIAIFSRKLGPHGFSPMMYAFETTEAGRPLHEVACTWEMRQKNQIVDRSTAGREWFPPWLDDLVLREDGPARDFLNQLTTPPQPQENQ